MLQPFSISGLFPSLGGVAVGMCHRDSSPRAKGLGAEGRAGSISFSSQGDAGPCGRDGAAGAAGPEVLLCVHWWSLELAGDSLLAAQSEAEGLLGPDCWGEERGKGAEMK